MNKVSSTIIVSILFLPFLSFSQRYEAGDTLFVWNLDGTVLHPEPSHYSLPLDILQHRSSLVIPHQDVSPEGGEKHIEGDFYLYGFWVKASVNGQEGYIFDGDLSREDPNVNDEHEQWNLTDLRFLGNKVKKEKVVRTEVHYGNEYQITDDIDIYEFGRIVVTFFDGCWDHVNIYEDITFNEVYHLIMNAYQLTSSTYEERPIYEGKEDNRIWFSGTDAIGQILIITRDDGKIEIHTDSCT